MKCLNYDGQKFLSSCPGDIIHQLATNPHQSVRVDLPSNSKCHAIGGPRDKRGERRKEEEGEVKFRYEVHRSVNQGESDLGNLNCSTAHMVGTAKETEEEKRHCFIVRRRKERLKGK